MALFPKASSDDRETMKTYTKDYLLKLWKLFQDKIDVNFAKSISNAYGDYNC